MTNTYRPLLEKWCRAISPMRIIEWGPGESTCIMMKLCPEVEITSVEHNKRWFEEWKHLGCVILREAPEENRKDLGWLSYINAAEGKFDLAFVDGRERVRCLKFAKEHLNPSGVAILHDAHREEYREGIELFRVVERDSDTVVLGLKS